MAGDGFCRQCGGRIGEADKFCGKCGGHVSARAPVPPTAVMKSDELGLLRAVPPTRAPPPMQAPPSPATIELAGPQPTSRRRGCFWASLVAGVLVLGLGVTAAVLLRRDIGRLVARVRGTSDAEIVQVVLPDGAAWANVEPRIRATDDAPTPPEDFTPIGDAYDISLPAGTPAPDGAWVRLPLDDAESIPAGDELVIARHDGARWQMIPAIRGDGCAFARVPGFSTFWAGRVTMRMRPDANEGPQLRVEAPWLWGLEVEGDRAYAVLDVTPARLAWSPHRWRPVEVRRLEVLVTRPDRTRPTTSAAHFMPSMNESSAQELRTAEGVVTLRTTRGHDRMPLPIDPAPMQAAADTQVQRTYPWAVRVRPVFADGQVGPLSAPIMVPVGVTEAHIRLREGLAARLDGPAATAFLEATAARPYWILVSRAIEAPWFWQRHRSGSYGPVVTRRERAQSVLYFGQADHRVLYVADDSTWERVVTHEWGHYATHNMLGDAGFTRFPAGRHTGWKPADSRSLAWSEDIATFLGQWAVGHGIPEGAGAMRGMWETYSRNPIGDAENIPGMWPAARDVDAARVEGVPATILSRLAREIGFATVYGVLRSEAPGDVALFFFEFSDAADVARLQRIYLDEGVAWRVRGTILAEEEPGAEPTPLEGASVRATTETGEPLVAPSDLFGEGAATATTDAQGMFELVLPPGDVLFEVSKPGYRPRDPPFRFGGVTASRPTNDPAQLIETRYVMRRGEVPTVHIDAPATGDRVSGQVTVSGTVAGTQDGSPDGEPIETMTLHVGGQPVTIAVSEGRFSHVVTVTGGSADPIPIRAVAENEIGPGEHAIEVRSGCPEGHLMCAEQCVESMSNNQNCGACGTACGTGTTCVHGHCVGTGALRISMSWSHPGDMDLRVVTPGEGEIYYGRREAGGGELDRDDLTGTGPENVFWRGNVPAGTYLVCANPFSIREATSFTIEVHRQGAGTQTFTGSRAVAAPRTCTRDSPDFVTAVVVGGP